MDLVAWSRRVRPTNDVSLDLLVLAFVCYRVSSYHDEERTNLISSALLHCDPNLSRLHVRNWVVWLSRMGDVVGQVQLLQFGTLTLLIYPMPA